MMHTGICPVSGAFRNRLKASMPSVPGIERSRVIRSGRDRRRDLEGPLAVGGLEDRRAVIGQQGGEEGPDLLVVVDDQDAGPVQPTEGNVAEE